MDVTESSVDVEQCEETEGEVSSTCNDNVRLDDNTVNSDIISSDCQSFVVMSNDSSENSAILQEETSHSLSPDTSGVVLRYISEGDGVVCMPFETQGDMNTVQIQEGVVEEEEEEVNLTSDLETVPEVGIPVATDDDRETISLEENVLISTTMDEGDYAVLNWEGEEIVEMSSADNLDLQEQMEQSVDVSSATQDTSSLDAEGNAQLAAHSLPFASNPDSTTIETSEANNNIVIYENEVSTTGDELCMVSTSLVIPVSTTTAVASNESLSVPGSSTSVTAGHSSGSIPICMPRQRREESQLNSEISPQNSGISTTSLKDESAHKRRWDQAPVSGSCNLSSNTERLSTSQSCSQREGETVSFERVNPTYSGKNQSEKVPKLDPVSSSKDSNLHSHTLSQPSTSDHQESNIDTTSQAQFRSVSHPSQEVGRDLGSTSDSTTTDAGVSKVKDSSAVASSVMTSFKEDYGNGATSSTSNDDSLESRVPSVDDSSNQVSKSSEAVALEQNTCEISDTSNDLKSPHSSEGQDRQEIPEATHSGLRDNSETSPPSPLKDLHNEANKGKDNLVSRTGEDDRAKHAEALSGRLCTVPAETCLRIGNRTLTSSNDPPTSSSGEKSSNTTAKPPERKPMDHGNEKSRFSILSGCRKPLVGSSVASETLKSSRLGAGKGSSEESWKGSKTLEDREESVAVGDSAEMPGPSSSGVCKASGSTETKNVSVSPSQENKTDNSQMASRNATSVSMTSSSPEERNSSKGVGNLGTLKTNVIVSDSSMLEALQYSKETVKSRQTVPKAKGMSATSSKDRQQDAPSLCDKSESVKKSSVIAKVDDETKSSSTDDNLNLPKEKQPGEIFSASNECGPVAKPGEPASLSTFEDPTEVKSSNQLEKVCSIGTKTSLKSENDSEKMKSDHSETPKINPERIKTYSRFTSESGKSAMRIKGPHVVSSQAIKLERPETIKTSRWDVATYAPKTKHDALLRDVAKISEKEGKPSHSGQGNSKLGKDDESASVKGTSKASLSCTESTPKIGIVSSYCKTRDRPSGKEAATAVSKGDRIGHDPIVTAPCSSSKSEDLKSNVLKSVGVDSKLPLSIKSDPSLTTKLDSISSSTAPVKTRVKLVRPPLSSVRESSSVTSSKLTIRDTFQEKLSEKKPEVAVAAKTTSKGDVISSTEETDKEKEMEDLDSEPHSFPKEMRTYSRLDAKQGKGSHSKRMKSFSTKELSLKRDVEKEEETQYRSITSVPKQATARPSIRKSYMKDCAVLSSKESPSPIKFESKASEMEKDDIIKSDDNVLFTETAETTGTSEEASPIQPLALKSVDDLNIDIETSAEVPVKKEERKSADGKIGKSLCDKTELVTSEVCSTPSNLHSKEQYTRDQSLLIEIQQDRKTSAEDPSSVSKSKGNIDADMTSTDKCQSLEEFIKPMELQRTSKMVTSANQIPSKSTVGREIICHTSPGEKTTEHMIETKETNRTKGGYELPMKEERSLAVEVDLDERLHKSEPTNASDCNLAHETGDQNEISEEKRSIDKPEQLPEDRPDITEVKQSNELPEESPVEDGIHGHIKTDSQEIVKETTQHTEEIKDVAIVDNSDKKKSEKIAGKSQSRQKYEEHEVLQMLTEVKTEEEQSLKEPSSKENLGSFKSSEEQDIVVKECLYPVEENSVSLGVSIGVEDITTPPQPEKEGEGVNEIKDNTGALHSVEFLRSADKENQKDMTKSLNKSDSSEQELKKTAHNKIELRSEVMEDTSQSEKQNVDGETSRPRAENNILSLKAGALEAALCVAGNASQSSEFDQTSKENIIQTAAAPVEEHSTVQKKDDESIVSQSFDSQSDTIEVSKISEEDKKEDITSDFVKPEEKEPEVMFSFPTEIVSASIKPDSTVELKISTCAEKTDEWEIFEGSDTEKSQKEDTDGVSSGSGDELEEIAAFLRQSEEESRIGSSYEGKELGETVSITITSSGDNHEGNADKESTVTEGKLEEAKITVATEHAPKQDSNHGSVADPSEQNITASSSEDIDKDVVVDDSLLGEESSKEVNQEDMVTESGSFSSEKVVSVIQEMSEGKTNNSITEIDKNVSENQSQSEENRISSSNVEEAESEVGKTEKIILKITKDKKSPEEFSVQEVEDGRKTESENSGGNNTAAKVQDFELASSSGPASLKVTEESAEDDRKTPITLKLVKDASSEGKSSGPEYMSIPSALEKEAPLKEGNAKKTEYGEQDLLVASSENTKVNKFMSKKDAKKLETSVSSSTSAVMASSESTSQPSQVSSSGMSDESDVGKLMLKLKLPSSNETGSIAVISKASTSMKQGSSKQLESSSVHEEEQPKVEKLTLKLKKDGNCENVTYTKSEAKAEVSPKVEKLTIKTKTDGSSECIVAEPINANTFDTCQSVETKFIDSISLEQSPKVEKLTLRLRKDSVGSDSSKSYIEPSETKHSSVEDSPKREKITLRIRTDSGSSEISNVSKRSRKDSCSSEVCESVKRPRRDSSNSEFSVVYEKTTSGSPKVTDTHTEECTSSEKITLTLRKVSSNSELLSTQEKVTASGDSEGISEENQLSSSVSREENKVAKLTLKLKPDPSKGDKKDGKETSLLEDAITSTSNVDKSEETPKVEKLTLKLKKDQVSSAKDEDITDSSASPDVSKFEKDQKVEKLTFKVKKDQVSSAKDLDITNSSASPDVSKFEKDQKVEKLTLKVKKDQVSSAKDMDITDSSGSSDVSKFEKDQKVEKLTLKVKKDQVSSAKDVDITDSSGSSDVSKFEKDQKVEKLTLKVKKDQVSSAKDVDITDSSGSSDVSKFEKDQKVEKLALKVKKDQVSSAKDVDITDSSGSPDVSKVDKDQKVEKLTLKVKKDQVSSAKDLDITNSSASPDVSKFEKDQKVEKLTLKVKKDQVSSAKDMDITDSSGSSDVSKFEKDQKVEKLALKVKKDQVSSAKDMDITDSSASPDVSKFEKDQKVEKLTLKVKKDQVGSAKDVDITDSSGSSDVSKFEKDQKVEKLTLKVKKDQVSSAKDMDITNSSGSSDVSKFEKDQKVEKLTLKVKKDQVSSAKDVDITDSSASSDVSMFEKDQKVEKLTLKVKKDQVSSAKDVDITDSSASSDVSKFDKDQKVEKLALKMKKDQVSSAKDVDITDSSPSSDVSKFEKDRQEEQKVEKLTLKVKKDQVSSAKDVDIMDSSASSDVSKFEEEQKVEKLTLKLRKDKVSGSDDSSEGAKSNLESAAKEEQKVEKLTLKLKKDTMRCDSPSDNKSSGKDEKLMKEEKLALKLKKDMSKSDISDKEENKVEKITIKLRKESAHDTETKQPLQEYTISPTEKKKSFTVGTGKEEVKMDKVTLKIKKNGSKSEITTPSLSGVKPDSEMKAKKTTSKSETILPSLDIADKRGSTAETTALSTNISDQTCINVESKEDSKSETVLSSSSIGERMLSEVEINENSSKTVPFSKTSEEIHTDVEEKKNTSKSETVVSSSGAGEGMLSEVEVNKNSSKTAPSSNTSEEICTDVETKKNASESETVLSVSSASEGTLSVVKIDKNSSKAVPSAHDSGKTHSDLETKKNTSKLEEVPQSLTISDKALNVLVAKENSGTETVSPSSSTTDKTHIDVKTKKNAPLLKSALSSSLGDKKQTDKNSSKTDGLPTLSSDKTDESHTDKEIKKGDPKPEKVPPPPALNADSKHMDSKIEKDDLKDGTVLPSSLSDEHHTDVNIKRGDSKAAIIPSPTSSICVQTLSNPNVQNEAIKPETVSLSPSGTKDVSINEVVSPSEAGVKDTEMKDNLKLSSVVVSSEPTDSTTEGTKLSATSIRKAQDLAVSKGESDKDKPVSEEELKLDGDSEENSVVEKSPSELSVTEENVSELKTEDGKLSNAEPQLDDKKEGKRRVETKGEKQSKLETKADGKNEIMATLKAKEDKPSGSKARLDNKEEGKEKLEIGGEKIIRLETKVDVREEKMTTLKTKEDKLPDTGTRLDEKEEGKAKFETKEKEQLKLDVKVDVKEEKMATLKTKEKKLPNTRPKLDDKERGMKNLVAEGDEHSELEAKVDAKEKITVTVKTKEGGVAELEIKGEKQSKLEAEMDTKEAITATVKSKQRKLSDTGAKLNDKEQGMAKMEMIGEKQSKMEPKEDAETEGKATLKIQEEKPSNTEKKTDENLDIKEEKLGEKQSKLEPKMHTKEMIAATVKSKQGKLSNTGAKLNDKEQGMAKMEMIGEKQSKMEPKADAEAEGKATLKIQEEKPSNTEKKTDENLDIKEEKMSKLDTKTEKSTKLESKLEKPILKRKSTETCDASADVAEDKITSMSSRSVTEYSPPQQIDSVSKKLVTGDRAIGKVSRAPTETTSEEKQLPKTEMKLTLKESSDLKDEEPKSKRLKVEDKVLELPVVPPPVDEEVSQDVEVIYSAVDVHSEKRERMQQSPPRVEGKLREILSKMGGQVSKLLNSDLSISISQPETTPPVSQAPPGDIEITLVPDDKEVINLDSDSDTIGSTAAVPMVSPSPEQFEPLGLTKGLAADTGEPVKKKGRGRPRKSTLPAKPVPTRPESESRPKRMCRGREGPIVEPKKPRGGGRGRGRGRAAGMKRRAEEETPERKPGDRAFSEVSPSVTVSPPKIPRLSSPMDSKVSASPSSSPPPPNASSSSISVFGIPTPKCDNSLPSTTDSMVTMTTTVTSPTAGVKPSSTFSSILATTEPAGVSTAVTTSSPSAFFSLPTSISATTPSAKNAAPSSSTSGITQTVPSTDSAPVLSSKPAMSFLTSSPDSSGLPSFLSTPSRGEPELPASGLPVSTVQVFEEETRMSADCGSRSQTPARTLPSAGGGDGPGEESQGSAISTATTESVKKKTTGRMEVGDGEMKEFTVDQIAEYQWPPDKNGEHLMIQEQISEYLGVKSFKRKYPDLRRRFIDSEERTFLREKGLVSEGMCDMGLTAIYSSEVLDVMFNDFQEKYEEYRRYQRDRQAKELTSKQKGIAAAASADKSKQDYKEKAISSAASWNSKFNKARKDGRRACFDLQSFTIHYPRTRTEKMAAKDLSKVGEYPIALIPGQFTDFYKSYTPTELRYFPLNTVLYGPMKPNERQEAGGSDGSQSDSDESTSSDDSSSSSSSDGTQDTEETASTAGDGDQDVGPENGVAEKEGPEKGVKDRDGAVCKVCSGDKSKNKEGRSEVLIHCATCTSSGHVSCFDLTLDMVPHIRRYDWQCTDCKTCIQCKDPADEDKMLFCDMCDRGYHIYCVGLRRVPNGRWHCKECAVCGSCGAQEPCGNADPSSTPNAQWQHEYKKGEKGTRVYAQTLCVPCSKLWRKGRYCQLCWRCYGNKPEEEVGLINCTVCDKWMHADCCNTVGGIDVNRSNYLCEVCQEKGQARSPAVKLAMRPAVKV